MSRRHANGQSSEIIYNNYILYRTYILCTKRMRLVSNHLVRPEIFSSSPDESFYVKRKKYDLLFNKDKKFRNCFIRRSKKVTGNIMHEHYFFSFNYIFLLCLFVYQGKTF